MIYGESIKELISLNEHTIQYKSAAKGADAKDMYFYIGGNDMHDKSPRYKTAGSKALLSTKKCHEIDYRDQAIHHVDSSTASDAQLTDLGEKNSDAFGERYYLPLDINAKYPNDFTNKELADLIKNDLRKFEKKGKPISGRVRCEYDPDAAVGSRYSLVEMKPNESYDDYISSEYGYLDK